MRFLFLIQGKATSDHPGYHSGCKRLLQEGELSAYMPICYYGLREQLGTWKAAWEEVISQSREFQPDAVFLQFFHGPIEDVEFLMESLRRVDPHALIATSSGDPFIPGFLSFADFPTSLKISCAQSDICFSTQMLPAVRSLQRAGGRNFVLWPHGCCQERFKNDFDSEQWSPEFDLVFVGSNNQSRNPFSAFGKAGRKRENFVRQLSRRYGKRFGLFGRNWRGLESWQGTIPYAEQIETVRRGRLIFGGVPYTLADYYMSDRPLIMMGSGIPFLDHRVPQVEELFSDGKNWYLYDSVETLFRTIDRLLEMPADTLLHRAGETADLIFSRHTQYHRMRTAVGILSEVAAARRSGKPMPLPKLDFFLPDSLQPGAVYAWQG